MWAFRVCFALACVLSFDHAILFAPSPLSLYRMQIMAGIGSFLLTVELLCLLLHLFCGGFTLAIVAVFPEFGLFAYK